MEMKMNKREFIKELEKELSYPNEKCVMINEILEQNFFIRKENREKTVEELIKELNIKREEAARIYDTATNIIKDEIKNKLKHPFRSQD